MKLIYNLFIFIALSYLFSSCGGGNAEPSPATGIAKNFKAIRFQNLKTFIKKGSTPSYVVMVNNKDVTAELTSYFILKGDTLESTKFGFLVPSSAGTGKPIVTVTMPDITHIHSLATSDISIVDDFTCNNLNIFIEDFGNFIAKGAITSQNLTLKTEDIAKIEMNVMNVKNLVLNIVGGSNCKLLGKITGENVTIIPDATSSLNIDNFSNVTNISLKQQYGISKLIFKGTAKNLSIENRTDVDCFGLIAENVTVVNTSIGDTKINATKTLNANIKWLGNIYYKGNPVIVLTKTGTGKLINAN